MLDRTKTLETPKTTRQFKQHFLLPPFERTKNKQLMIYD